ncbi:MAG: hypothetical protein ACSHXH_14465 [Marivita sp.]|uniref:hypothetical protein n=1 Tax=Marivita sp. TaxID=2003365 RepID=UPI003EFA4628
MFRTAVIALFLATSPVLADPTDPLIPIADAERGTFVTVAGEVTRIMDEDTFRLTDASDDIRIYIGPNRMPVRNGDTVTISGFVDDNLLGPREIYAETALLSDGSTVTFDKRYD